MASCDIQNIELQKAVNEITQQLGSRQKALEHIKSILVENKRTTIIEAQRYNEILKDLSGFEGTTQDAFLWTMVADPRNRARFSNVDKASEALIKTFQAKVHDILGDLRTDVSGGVKNPKMARDVAREMGGESTGNAAASKGAKEISELFEEIRVRFNAAGGNIQKLDGKYGLPQTHSDVLMSSAGKEDWKAFIMPLLDLARMRRNNPLVDIDDALNRMYDNIVLNRQTKFNKGAGGKATGNIAEKHQENRFIHFTNVEKQFEYNTKFGHSQGDTGAAVIGHIEKMSNEITLMERFGPEPQKMIERLESEGTIDLSSGKGTFIATHGDVWKVVTGVVDETQNITAARGMSNARSWMTATKLGSASLASISDIATATANAGFWGLPRKGIITANFKGISKTDAAHMGFVSDTIGSRGFAVNRFSGEADNTTVGFAQRAAETVLRVTGLAKWTEGMRKAFILNTSHWFGTQSSKAFKELKPKNQALLSAYEITPNEWDLIRIQAKQSLNGSDYIVHSAIADSGLADKWMRMLQTETSMAVPTPDARIRAVATSGHKKGTAKGELSRSVMQFKSFPLQIMMSNLSRGMAKGNKAYLAEYVTSATIMGFVALNLKAIASGKEPINPFDLDAEQGVRVFLASLIQGGAGGIIGDIFLNASGADGFTPDVLGDLAGPLAGDSLSFITDLLFGNMRQLAEGKDTNFLAELAKFGLKELPGNNIWMTKLVLVRLFEEYILENLDKKFKSKVRRNRKKMKEHYNQDYFWKPGDLTPK